MSRVIDFDSIGIDQLQRAGGAKWTSFPGMIGAFVAEMDFGTAPTVLQAVRAATDRGLFGYLPNGIADQMSEAAANWQRDTFGWDLRPEQVYPVADVITALELAIRHYSKPGSRVIVPTPTYMKFLTVPAGLGREIIEIPLARNNGRDEIDLEALDGAFRDGGGILLLCNPYNPVGRVFTRDELLGISDVVSRNGGRVFADEVHAPLVYAGATHIPYASVSTDAARHTVTGTSAAKAWNLAGLKCAQVIISNDADAVTWEDVGPMARHGASNLGVVASTAAYSTGRSWLDQVLAYNDRNRQVLGELIQEHIPAIRYTQPEGTYIAWLDCRELGIGDRPAEFFRERAGVALTDGASCGVNGTGFVRMTFGTPRPILEQAIHQMAGALRSRGWSRQAVDSGTYSA